LSCGRAEADRAACSKAGYARASEAGRCVSGTRAEALRPAVCTAAAGVCYTGVRIAFVDSWACRRGPVGAAAGHSSSATDPHGAEARVAKSGGTFQLRSGSIEPESGAASPRLGLYRFDRIIVPTRLVLRKPPQAFAD